MGTAAIPALHLQPHDGGWLVRGTAVAMNECGILFIGASGSGKSSLALDLMAYGAKLVGDDQVRLDVQAGTLWMSPPPNIDGQIEARGLGILRADTGRARLGAVVDLDQRESERLPPTRTCEILDQTVRLFHKVESGHFPAALCQYLKGGQSE